MIFEKDIIFSGKHGYYMSLLCGEGMEKVFARNIDLFMVAPLIGYTKGWFEEPEKIEQEPDIKRTINTSQLISESRALEAIYQLVTLCDQTSKHSVEEKVNLAFRIPHSVNAEDKEKQAEAIEVFMKYCRGGISYIYQEVKNEAFNFSDELENMRKLIKDYELYQKDTVNSVEELGMPYI